MARSNALDYYWQEFRDIESNKPTSTYEDEEEPKTPDGKKLFA